MRSEEGLSLQQAVGDWFGITLSRHPKLRNSVNTLAKALAKDKVIDLIESKVPSASDRSRLSIPKGQRERLCNAVLLQGVFAEPKSVIRIFKDPIERRKCAQLARDLLLPRDSVAGLGLIRPELVQFLEAFASDHFNLYEDALPNPFETLPQMGLGPTGDHGLLRAVATQTAALSLGDSMMACYLDGDLEKAYAAAASLQTDSPVLQKYRRMIIDEYEEARAFDDLLDEWR